MFKRSLRWLIPLMVLLMLAAWLTFAPMLISHAAQVKPAAPTSAPAIQSKMFGGPNIIRFGR